MSDTNKTPTPRTDAAEQAAGWLWQRGKLDCQRVVASDLSRQLETELAEACAIMDEMAEKLLLYAGWNKNHNESGRELPMTRPIDVQEIINRYAAFNSKRKG